LNVTVTNNARIATSPIRAYHSRTIIGS
jgi:hypothetical protein